MNSIEETLKVENEQKINGNTIFLHDVLGKASNISIRDRTNVKRHTNQKSAYAVIRSGSKNIKIHCQDELLIASLVQDLSNIKIET